MRGGGIRRTGVRLVLIVLVMFSLMLALSGCSGGGSSSAVENYKQGTGGVTVSFIENAPPERIFESSSFKIVGKLENKAGYDVEGLRVRIVGLNEKYFEVEPREIEIGYMEGKSITNPVGGFDFIEFDGRSHILFLNAVERVEPLLIKGEFDSKLDFSDTICLNPNFYDIYDGGCQVQDSKSYSGQGAPMAITQMEQIMHTGDNPAVEFRFVVSNRGEGRIEEVELVGAQLGVEPIVCHFKEADINSIVRVEMGAKRQEAHFICREELDSTNSFESLVSAQLRYSYSFTEQSKLVLVNPSSR